MNQLAPITHRPSAITTEPHVSWWTPTGWITAPPPEAYRLAMAASGWNAFEKAGYAAENRMPDNDNCDGCELHLIWRRHDDGHVMVCLELGEVFEEFFVASEHWLAYLHQEAPALVNACAAQAHTTLLDNLVRTFAAFVRHGHRIDAIDEAGLTNLEQRRRNKQHIESLRAGSGNGTRSQTRRDP